MIRLLFLIFLLQYFQLNAQIKLDSLHNLLLNADGNDRIDLLNNLSSEWNFQNADSSRKYANMALELSGKENYKFGHSMALQNLGTSHEGQGHYEKALEYQRQSLQIVTNIEDSSQIAFVKNSIGVIHDQRGDFDKALNAYFQSLAIYDSLNEIEGQAKVYNNIGIIYKKQGHYEEVINFYKKALSIYEELNYNFGIAATKGNIGALYLELREYDLAMQYSRESVDLCKKEDIHQYIPYGLENIGIAHRGLNNLTEAKKYHLQALNLYLEYGNKKESAFTLNSLAQIEIDNGNFEPALDYANRSLKIASGIGVKEEISQANLTLSRWYALTDNYKVALEKYKMHISVKDSIFEIEKTHQIAELQTRYETAQKDKEIGLLTVETEYQNLQIEQSKYQILGLAIFFILLIIILFLFNIRRRYIERLELSREKEQIQKSRFRAVIEGEEKERKRIAQELHDGLGQLLSTARLNVAGLDDESNPMVINSLKLIDDACTEVRSISHNMMPNALISIGFEAALKEQIHLINGSGKIKVHLELPDQKMEIEETKAIALYRIIQEVLNNAIKYSEATNIRVILRWNKSGEIEAKITDDGKGFDISKIEISDGIGWQNIYSRMDILNGSINITSEINSGTSVNLKIAI